MQRCHLVLISIKLQRLFSGYYVPPEVINKLTLKRASNLSGTLKSEDDLRCCETRILSLGHVLQMSER